MPAEDRAGLKQFLRELSICSGDFVLASGKRSNLYIDARLTTCHARAMPLIGRVFLDKMDELGWRAAAAGGLTMGADPIAVAIARESLDRGAQPINAFVVRKEAKKHGMQQSVEGLALPAQMDVVVVDDVCSTGGSTVTAVERAREAGLNVLGAICLVDRNLGARENLTAIGCRFESIFEIAELTG